jgi:hypothetical protein
VVQVLELQELQEQAVEPRRPRPWLGQVAQELELQEPQEQLVEPRQPRQSRLVYGPRKKIRFLVVMQAA